MKNVILTIGVAAASVLVLAGCTKDPLKNMTEEESRIYITNRDSTANFSSYATFSVSDSVAVINNNKLEKKSLTDADAAFINATKANLQSRGYTLVTKDQHPDLGINISRVYNTYTGIVSYPDYWGGYPGIWDPWYWGYPGYGYGWGGFYGVYSIKEGALSIDALDLKNAAADKKIKGIWNGLIRGSGIFRPGAGESQIKALFDQSPYFKK
ncbi:DUF4136 domain-containing protein [Pseudoflavitalea sp. G-6-1-2]|uniref:DUF4136 domain-containing protein n=1 Tax=Pseudoflavitalea sp. G-6-1-2 TaxID=2728841 RepID=UPI00146E6E81|nr:DUF4136 domain-containing protein [Pseudoflavitalea sp. G-6-1-2]NML20741.1 DUF4136 domain-containing protein [Pseudoflavitalea sp. G-6-1-2]